MKKIATTANADLATPADMQLFFTFHSICEPDGGCLNGYAWTVGNICVNPSQAVSITTGGHFNQRTKKWYPRNIVQIAKTAAHEMGTVQYSTVESV